MTDYKSLKLIASSSPHIRSNEDTRSIMLDVIIALMPALIMGIYVFGWRALTDAVYSPVISPTVGFAFGMSRPMVTPATTAITSRISMRSTGPSALSSFLRKCVPSRDPCLVIAP